VTERAPPRPWLFTCRHTFEPTLCAELGRLGWAQPRVVLPGLVDAGPLPQPLDEPRATQALLPTQAFLAALQRHDPVYALQVLPEATSVHGVSVRDLARAATDLALPWLEAIGGPWSVHALVPAQLKGTPKPPMQRRAALVADALKAEVHSRARRVGKLWQPAGTTCQTLVQVLLVEAEVAWVSVAPVLALAPAAAWPSALPAGLADVADDLVAPASSYRKLHEALACMGELPQPGQTAVDLGACPGGWTRVLRKYGAQVVAVDRTPLAAHLMADPEVTFIAGDAFAFRPQVPVDWMVSDVIAFPERAVELIEIWCRAQLAKRLVVQMKFKGEPDLQAMAAARAQAAVHGYEARAKHFFNDKNEVTWMVVHRG